MRDEPAPGKKRHKLDKDNFSWKRRMTLLWIQLLTVTAFLTALLDDSSSIIARSGNEHGRQQTGVL
jgi:hypothetical protein